MKRFLFILVFSALMCLSCVATVGPQGTGVAIAPPLPATVELVDPYYNYGGYFYFYDNDRWFYSHSRGGPWRDLPREHYPKEVRFKGHGGERDWGHERGRGHERDER